MDENREREDRAELTDEELEAAAGGMGGRDGRGPENTAQLQCPYCKAWFDISTPALELAFREHTKNCF